jgi:NAD-dependent dihydropyrimidine dehydrogenase PreA subunit
MEMKYLKNVATLQLDASRCTGCGMCLEVCPHAVFRMENRKSLVADRDACMECGACARNCPASAISVRAGVGCAAAIIYGALKGTEPTCGCGADSAGGKELKCGC